MRYNIGWQEEEREQDTEYSPVRSWGRCLVIFPEKQGPWELGSGDNVPWKPPWGGWFVPSACTGETKVDNTRGSVQEPNPKPSQAACPTGSTVVKGWPPVDWIWSPDIFYLADSLENVCQLPMFKTQETALFKNLDF